MTCENRTLRNTIVVLEAQNRKLQEALFTYPLACGDALDVLTRIDKMPGLVLPKDCRRHVRSIIFSLIAAQRVTATLRVDGASVVKEA